jgi:pimeloyl-ACP methyl ester carboxylesterase
MPTPIRLLEFARLCAAIYDSAVTSAAGFARSGFTQRRSGFQGAYFARPNGQGADYVVTIAGTQPGDDFGADIVANAGFGGNLSRGAVVVPVIGPMIGPILAAGPTVLEKQLSLAEQMVGLARGVATRPGDRVFITGHSLGGGIAQIVAARTGVAAVAISAPAVTAVSGVLAAWQRTRAPIFCLRVRNDPINETSRVGAWLGRVQTLPSNRTGGDAHSIDQTVLELSPSGQFSVTGNEAPHG